MISGPGRSAVNDKSKSSIQNNQIDLTKARSRIAIKSASIEIDLAPFPAGILVNLRFVAIRGETST